MQKLEEMNQNRENSLSDKKIWQVCYYRTLIPLNGDPTKGSNGMY